MGIQGSRMDLYDSRVAGAKLFPGSNPRMVIATDKDAAWTREFVYKTSSICLTVRETGTRSFTLCSEGRFRKKTITRIFRHECNGLHEDHFDKTCKYENHKKEVDKFGKCGVCVIRRCMVTMYDEYILYHGNERESACAREERHLFLHERTIKDSVSLK